MRQHVLFCSLFILLLSPVFAQEEELAPPQGRYGYYPDAVIKLQPFMETGFTFSTFSGVPETGTHFGAGLGCSHLLITGSYLELSGGYSFVNPENMAGEYEREPIYNRLDLLAAVGYGIPIGDSGFVTPLIGGGTQLHILRTQVLEDKILLLGVMGEVNIYKNHHILLAADWLIPLPAYGLAVIRTPVTKLSLGLKKRIPVLPEIPEPFTLTLTITPDVFSPDDDGFFDTVMIKPAVQGKGRINSWSVVIYDPSNQLFISFPRKGYDHKSDQVPKVIVWNGFSMFGDRVISGMEYPVSFETTDRLGRVSRATGIIRSDLLVIKEDQNLKVSIPNITFSPNTSLLLLEGDQESAVKNREIISRLRDILNKYEAYQVRIEGHANNLSWEDPVKQAAEEREILIPLSKSRAEAVKQAMEDQGIDPGRIVAVGYGGSRPLVPFSDLENRWKNRRVEIILIKQ